MPELAINFFGGINEQSEADISLSECFDGENFKLDQKTGSYRPRDPFDLIADVGGDIRGIMQLIKRDNSETLIVQHSDTVSSIDSVGQSSVVGSCNAFSKLRADQRSSHWGLDDYLIITDTTKLTPVKKWDGAAFSSLAHGLTGDLFARYSLVHQGRVWLFNISNNGVDNEHMILVSAFEDPENYNIGQRAGTSGFTGAEPFFLLTKDLKSINGVCLYFDTIIVSTQHGKMFRLTGDSSQNYQFVEFYPSSSATGTESILNIGNDVLFMRDGGIVESLRSTDRYGDVSSDDVSRPIQSKIAGTDNVVCVYDRGNDTAYFFSDRIAFVYDKATAARTDLSPWSIYTSLMPSFSPNAAAYIKVGDRFTTVFGGSSGKLYDLNGEGSGDQGIYQINCFRSTKMVYETNNINALMRGRLLYKKKQSVTMDAVFSWSDENTNTQCQIPLKQADQFGGGNYWGGGTYWGDPDAYWSQVDEFVESLSTAGFTPAGKGFAFVLTLRTLTANKFDIHKGLIVA